MSLRLNLVSTIERLVGRPAPQARQEPKPASGPVMAADTLSVSPVLRNSRFAGTPELDAVLKGGQLAKGAKGDAVAHVQQALQDMAFVLPAGVDGGFGNQTAQALKNFQSAAKLPQTGVLDRDTLVALDKFAPPAGQTSWEPGADRSLVPSPDLGKGKKARVVVDISQHRLFLFDKNGDLEKIYGVRSGNSAKGWGTQAGLKVIDGKNNDPKAVAQSLWGGTGTAFGTRLLNLSDYNLETGKKFYGKHKGQELHGTFDNNSIGQDFSHGCVGLKNADIEEIFDKLGNGEFVRFDQ
jgi:peptidoglycan hydrolase-like protein with peptidoglycan-binding domain